MEYESNGDTNCKWGARKYPQRREELEIEATQTSVLLGSARILRRIPET